MNSIKVFMVLGCMFLFGCEGFRFAPSQQQKQNAWLHNQTAMTAAQKAKQQQCSKQLVALTELSEAQSRPFVSYFGLPEEFPPVGSVDDILAPASTELAHTALEQSAERIDGWQLADSAIELAIGVAALLGGVYGTRAVRYLAEARTKSKALKEIVEGNELFKRQNVGQADRFKEAHKKQSTQTKQIVAQLK